MFNWNEKCCSLWKIIFYFLLLYEWSFFSLPLCYLFLSLLWKVLSWTFDCRMNVYLWKNVLWKGENGERIERQCRGTQMHLIEMKRESSKECILWGCWKRCIFRQVLTENLLFWAFAEKPMNHHKKFATFLLRYISAPLKFVN